MFSIKLADTLFTIHNRFDYVQKLCTNYLCEGQGVEISVTHEEIAREQTGNSSDAYLESLAVYRKIAEYLVDEGVLLFHGSAIAVDGEGYLFTAVSGTGKSTHTRLWRQAFGDRAVMINDDKPLLRITSSGVSVYGTPWNGKHRLDTNTAVPLKAVCILHRGQDNSIAPIAATQALPVLLQQSYRSLDPEKMRKILHLVGTLAEKCSLYSLYCNMDPQAALVAYEGMNGGKTDETD